MSADIDYLIDAERVDDAPHPARKWTLADWMFIHSRAIALGVAAIMLSGLAYVIYKMPKPQPQVAQIVDKPEASGTHPGGVAVPVDIAQPQGTLGNLTVRGEALLDATVVTSDPAEAVKQMAHTFKTSNGKQYRVSVMVWQEQ